jgi:predicted AAA+ superfamily ATPase
MQEVVMMMNTNNTYLPRLIEKPITESMKTNGCIVIEGPKWCGKSTTSERFAKSVIKLQKPATYKQYRILADIGDDNLLSGEKPILFDEWQKIPELWDYVRNYIDETSGKGLFILTGSAKPIEDKERHSGIGRMKKIIMRTMSLWESNESSGEVSLRNLFDNTKNVSGKNRYQLKDIAHIICRGGFPSAVIEKDKDISLNYAKDYVNTLVSTDITSVDDIKRNSKRARSILKSYARNISTPAKMTTILKDVESNIDTQDIRTINSYIDAFSKLFVIDETESWTPKLRSKTAIRTTSTKHFVDPSIATAILDANPNDLMQDLNTFGLLFENLVIRDLKIYTQSLDGNVYNYRDKSGLEADAVIHLNDGRWGLIEIKLGGETLINEGALTLTKLKEVIDQDKMNKPAFLAIITATDSFAYQREDGIYVIPIACLKP